MEYAGRKIASPETLGIITGDSVRFNTDTKNSCVLFRQQGKFLDRWEGKE